jgi:hypothetical protein
MFIKEVIKRYHPSNKKVDYVQHRLMESIRTPQGPRQKLVLHLGTLSIPKDKFSELANLIEGRVYHREQLDLLKPHDAELQTLAHHFSELIIRKRIRDTATTEKKENSISQETMSPRYETIDVHTTTTSVCRTVGAEHIALHQLTELSFFAILKECGFKETEQCYAAAQVVSRMCHPASERETARWLRNTSAMDELLKTDFSKLSDMTLHRISDRLYKHQEVIEKKLAEKTKDLFSLKETLILYDLTNTYFESPKRTSEIARYGVSKEKRTDCPLVTLALVVDGQGFPKKSKIFAGNISEPKTFWQILEELSADNTTKMSQPQTIIMDAGIATEENLRKLRADKRFEYVAISRKRKWDRSCFVNGLEKEIKLSRNKTLKITSARIGDEILLICKSPDRLLKDEAIFNRRRQKFEKGLKTLSDGLKKTRTRKEYASVLERVGRLKERYKVGKYYEINVKQNEGKAEEIQFVFQGNKCKEPGEYIIRSSRIDLCEKELSELHRTLIMIENAFHWLKSYLGMRPNFHQLDRRMKGHIYISVLAYFMLAPLLNKLHWGGPLLSYGLDHELHDDWDIPYGWSSVVAEMATQNRVTTSAIRNDGKRIDIRTTVEPTSEQIEIYQRLNISSHPLKRIITVK